MMNLFRFFFRQREDFKIDLSFLRANESNLGEIIPDFAFAVPIFSKALPVGSLPTLKTENSISV
jgi:hypothetical protein